MANYKFKRDDNGEVFEGTFEQAMSQDVLGRITLPDGVTARRVVESAGPSAKRETRSGEVPIVSDSLGFCEGQLSEFESDRKRHGFTGIEFVRDPSVPQFLRVRCGSRSEWAKYVAHRGMHDMNSRNGSGASITEEELNAAKNKGCRALRRCLEIFFVADCKTSCQIKHLLKRT